MTTASSPSGIGNDKTATEELRIASNVGKEDEIDVVAEEPEKTYYSTVSVWLMVLFSGLAIGSDGYNAAVIGNVELLLAILYPDDLTSTIYQRLSNAFLIGMIVGMLLFGVIVDQLGRKTGAVATTLLLVLGITLSTAASGNTPTGMFWMLIIARGVAGVGAGGEYPVSGAGAAEATDEDAKYRKRRGFMFAMLADLSSSLGYIWGALVPLLLLLCVGQEVSKYHIVWRTSFALGMAPPLLIFWFRMRMAVSTAYRKSAMRKQRTPYWLALKRYWRPLLGSASTWFLYNWISIPFGIFSSTIMSRANAGDSLVKTLGWGVVINCFYIPGPFIGGYLSDKIGRRQTMALGFTLQAILGFVLGGAMNPIQNVFPLFVVLYGIFLTLGEVGPGSTVVLTASECFPTSIRGQMMGFISAFSKAGAAIGTQVFTAILNSYTETPSKGNQVAFLIGSGFAVLGALIALFVIPDVSRRLNDDDEAWKKYLAENGWEAQWGDEVTRDPSGVVMNKTAS
ncbi:major facilitator superfamily transporter [Colletotrichum karsti]|uniref:Major facilitator superfamily transporter n=1 Tax=Colletotrichum karsti TaxID=1095194 RepID=A0A9P6LJ99_9PEZI|nr:major facilitator superfamily transporter [Colletotrichum karsti]KAF9874382.1 major facilitator superfamily transporter [Colletotrichum karsti]